MPGYYTGPVSLSSEVLNKSIVGDGVRRDTLTFHLRKGGIGECQGVWEMSIDDGVDDGVEGNGVKVNIKVQH